MKLEDRCRNIELILCDVDGVLTDGGVVLDDRGVQLKQFHIRDGLGVKIWRRAGFRVALITGRTSNVVQQRADELGIDIVRQGVGDKLPVARGILQELGLSAEQACAIGDDLPDLPVINAVGLGVAVADACPELCESADYVTKLAGGRGAVRETIELILRSQGRWPKLIEQYTKSPR